MSTDTKKQWLPVVGMVAAAALVVFAIAVVRADSRKQKARKDDDDSGEIVTPIFDPNKSRKRDEAKRQRIDDDAPPSDASANDNLPSEDPSTRSRDDASESSQSSEPSGQDPNAAG